MNENDSSKKFKYDKISSDLSFLQIFHLFVFDSCLFNIKIFIIHKSNEIRLIFYYQLFQLKFFQEKIYYHIIFFNYKLK
jgi:hypothetical protein